MPDDAGPLLRAPMHVTVDCADARSLAADREGNELCVVESRTA